MRAWLTLAAPLVLGACGETRYAAWVSFDVKLMVFALLAAVLLAISINALYWRKLSKTQRWVLSLSTGLALFVVVLWLLNVFAPTPALRFESVFPV